MAIHWDDIAVLRTLDEWEGQGRAYHMTGQDLMQAVAGVSAVEDADRQAFVRLLHLLAMRGRVVFRVQSFGNYQPQPHDSNYLSSLMAFQLTETGRDRARGRVVYEGLPAPDEDDGRPIPGIVLERVTEIVVGWYHSGQVTRFLAELGIPPLPADPKPTGTFPEQTYQRLVNLEGDSESRQVLRGFLGRFLNGSLDIVPDPEQYDELVLALGKAGWHVRGDTIIVGERVRLLADKPAAPIEVAVSSMTELLGVSRDLSLRPLLDRASAYRDFSGLWSALRLARTSGGAARRAASPSSDRDCSGEVTTKS